MINIKKHLLLTLILFLLLLNNNLYSANIDNVQTKLELEMQNNFTGYGNLILRQEDFSNFNVELFMQCHIDEIVFKNNFFPGGSPISQYYDLKVEYPIDKFSINLRSHCIHYFSLHSDKYRNKDFGGLSYGFQYNYQDGYFFVEIDPSYSKTKYKSEFYYKKDLNNFTIVLNPQFYKNKHEIIHNYKVFPEFKGDEILDYYIDTLIKHQISLQTKISYKAFENITVFFKNKFNINDYDFKNKLKKENKISFGITYTL
ncbi:MAG: hypothetical protein ACOCP8_03585 [archaeon]